MDSTKASAKPYDKLLQGARHRASRVPGRTLEEEADADRGRVLFSAPFRRLQNKAQVFSLETNAAIRSRLTHLLEVSSIGRYIAQQAIKAFTEKELDERGIAGKERSLITFVETACLLHDLGNPPFGHFGEIAISDWFHLNSPQLQPRGIGGSALSLWERHSKDFQQFDGNPQGFRISTRLQAQETCDLHGLNLTATTLASTLKYPWPAALIGTQNKYGSGRRKKQGYFGTEQDVFTWIKDCLGLQDHCRHPLAFLMEAADDVAYCVSDIEDGIEKGLITAREFSEYIGDTAAKSKLFSEHADQADKDNIVAIHRALDRLKDPKFQRPEDTKTVERLIPMQDFRAAIIRFFARRAGVVFHNSQDQVLLGNAAPLLSDGAASSLLDTLKNFAEKSLYSSSIVRHREITAHAVLFGLLTAYFSLMECDRNRFNDSVSGKHRDANGRPITRETGLVSRIAKKYLAVYKEAVQRSDEELKEDPGAITVMERVHRIQLIIDHITSMTDEFALQSFQLFSGIHVNPYRT